MIELTEAELDQIAHAMRRFTYDTGIIKRTVAEIVEQRLALSQREITDLQHILEGSGNRARRELAEALHRVAEAEQGFPLGLWEPDENRPDPRLK